MVKILIAGNVHYFVPDLVLSWCTERNNLHHVDDSKKGGAIILGCQKALDDGMDCVVYTDADNSVHLGQLGLLLNPYMEQNIQVILGNRKHKDSILVKQEERWGVGIKTLRHMQRMIGNQIFSQGIKDTQAAFKLYSHSALVDILKAPTVYDFSFDTDWILAAMVFLRSTLPSRSRQIPRHQIVPDP